MVGAPPLRCQFAAAVNGRQDGRIIVIVRNRDRWRLLQSRRTAREWIAPVASNATAAPTVAATMTLAVLGIADAMLPSQRHTPGKMYVCVCVHAP